MSVSRPTTPSRHARRRRRSRRGVTRRAALRGALGPPLSRTGARIPPRYVLHPEPSCWDSRTISTVDGNW
eukprot:1186702-Prorocentrum_minimum.AAC.2